jgi:molybdopterin biosynthesis enzyme MoaB
MKFAILTVSDSCHNRPELDKSGPALRDCLNSYSEFSNSTYLTGIVPDDVNAIKNWLIQHIPIVDVILTTGGTGFASR